MGCAVIQAPLDDQKAEGVKMLFPMAGRHVGAAPSEAGWIKTSLDFYLLVI